MSENYQTTKESLTVDEEEYELTLYWEQEHCDCDTDRGIKNWIEWHCISVECDLGFYKLEDHPTEKWHNIFIQNYLNNEYQQYDY